MRRRTVAIATALVAAAGVPASAAGEASDRASCVGQAASDPNSPPGSKGAFASNAAKSDGRAWGDFVSTVARSEC